MCNPTGQLDYKVIAETMLVADGNDYSGNDYISARYRGIPFEQGDILIKNVSVTEYTTVVKSNVSLKKP